MIVTLVRHVYASRPAAPGVYCLEAERSVAAVPQPGNWVQLAEGWVSVPVEYTTFMADGSTRVELARQQTDDPERIDESRRLVAEHGWKWAGPEPAADAAS